MASLDHSSNVVSLKLRNFLYRLCHFHYFIILPVFYVQKSIVLISQWQWHVDNRRSNHSRRTRKGRRRQQRPVDPIRKSWPKPNWPTSVVFAWLKCLTPRRTSSISKASIQSPLCQTASRKRHKMTVKPRRIQSTLQQQPLFPTWSWLGKIFRFLLKQCLILSDRKCNKDLGRVYLGWKLMWAREGERNGWNLNDVIQLFSHFPRYSMKL